jgi:hypothetical protein
MYHARHTAAPTRLICAALVAGTLLAWAVPARAQHEHPTPKPKPETPAPTSGDDAQHGASDAVHQAMTLNMAEGLHVRLTPQRAGTHADTVRVQILADNLRAAIGKYQDTTAAVGDGYKMFAPQLKEQAVYHFTNWTAAVKAAFKFDPTRPTSLLYVKEKSGEFKLIGAMYTAPARMTEADLEKRVPLSIARWHRHVNLCLTKKGEEKRYAEQKDGKLRFGPEGTIATEQDCKAADGRWFAQLFGWMVHANVFAGNDVPSIWGGAEGHEHH